MQQKNLTVLLGLIYSGLDLYCIKYARDLWLKDKAHE